VAPASADERRAANGWAFKADRRHPRKSTARVVNTTATRVTKKARWLRATRVRAMRVIMETSPMEEGDNGHNNQLGTKAAATARTVVATAVRAITTAARATAAGAKRATALAATTAMAATMATMAMTATTATMAMTATMMPNCDDNYENQVAMTARVTTTVARAMATGAKRATTAMTGTTATMATMATMAPNSDDAASGNEGIEDTK
jgi:hypothetical protein